TVTNAIDTSGVSGGAPPAVYQSERVGDVAYLLNNLVPGGTYIARLHFAEISPSVNNPGERLFDVLINGVRVLSDFDVLASAGAKFRAVTQDIKKQADSTGKIQVEFLHGSVYQAACNGLQIFASSPASQPPEFTGLVITNDMAVLTWQASPAV